MAVYQYAAATGFNVAAASLTNIETLLPYAPTVLFDRAVQTVGPVEEVTLSQRHAYNGNLTATWSFSALPYASFAALIVFMLGTFETSDAAVTIITRDSAWRMRRYNAYVIQPQLGKDFKYNFKGDVEDLTLRFEISAPVLGGFTFGFSSGFTN